MSRFVTLLILVLASAAPAGAAIRVVATTQDLAALAEAVGGDGIDVISLTRGTRDPHFAVARPSMIRRVNRADLILLVGADLEIGWLPPLLQAARNARIQPGSPGYLDLSTAVTLMGKPDSPISRAMGDVHRRGNPHYWLDPANGVRIARAIAGRLSELDPANADAYQARFAAFSATLNERLAEWRAKLLPMAGKSVIAYHTSFIYLANAFGFVVADEVEPKPGIAPSAAYLNQLIGRIQGEGIGLLLMEPYYERRSAGFLNGKTGIRVGVIPQSVGSMPGIETYFDLFDGIVAVINQEPET